MTVEELAFYCPIPAAYHPLASQAQAATEEWLRRFRLSTDDDTRSRLAAARTGILAAYIVPDCSPQWLQLMSDLGTWLFAFDDECDVGPAKCSPAVLSHMAWHIQYAIAHPLSPVSPTDRYALALRDIRDRLGTLASPDIVQRFVDGMRAFFLTEITKTGFAARGTTPTFEDYLTTRGFDCNALVFPLLWGALHTHTRPVDDARLLRLQHVTAALINWDNDILSHAKEEAESGNGSNLIDMMRSRTHSSPRQALVESLALRNQAMRLFCSLRDELLPDATPELGSYLAALAHYVQGNLRWHRESNRYHDPARSAASSSYAITSLEPPHVDPPDLPSISWWWNPT
ncbi:hypothetical protein ABZ611_10710 [Streptomyces sp. NPDC007861]|uniref:terpene synthase family protein n=1 Tax=Streptomyces sp. NPDC007861 TaxID=3154893 RepID=UPI00340570BC